MKRLLFAGFAALLFLGCTDNKATDEKNNPYRPISGLEIPTEVYAGQNLTLKGKGFAVDCKLVMQLNGTTNKSEIAVVSVDSKALVVAVPETLNLGFYVIRLTQNNATTTIGGINVRVNKFNEEDIEIYGLSSDEKTGDIFVYPASVSKQVKASNPLPNSSASAYGNNGFAVATPGGKVYYAGFDMDINTNKLLFQIGSYDIISRENTTPKPVSNLSCMGVIDGKFCILKTVDNKTYSLVEWNNGAETKIRDFDLSMFGDSPIWGFDWRFCYFAPTNTILISGNMGKGSDMSLVTFSLNLENGTVTKNGGDGNSRYWFVATETQLYCFAVTIDSNTEVSATKVFRIDNPQEWSVKGSGATLVATNSSSAFESPVYSIVTGKIYGFDTYDSFDALMTFDPVRGIIEGRRWVKPGLCALLPIPLSETKN